ncbi:hypothetical protein NL676_031045 [Syzygium grande]|nr:hypothetical protein NL676_031045 [Syzygium grande]
MFFSGDPSSRKRVALGGRSTKERDRQKLVEQTRLERERRSWLRKQTLAAIKIQKGYRGRKDVEAARLDVRMEFYRTYGKRCENVDRNCFGPDSVFLRQLIFFFNAHIDGDLSILVEVCLFIRRYVHDSGDLVSLFAGEDYLSRQALVDFRVKRLAYSCIDAVYKNRYKFRDQLITTSSESSQPMTLLLEAVALLIDPRLPWVCKAVGYLLQGSVFAKSREIVLAGQETRKIFIFSRSISALECVLCQMIPHTGQEPCNCLSIDPQRSFSCQLLTIPFLWQLFPHLKEVFAAQGLSQHYIHQMALCVNNHANILPKDLSLDLPGYACLLGNVLETAGIALSYPGCSFDMAVDIAAVASFLLEALPPIKQPSMEINEGSTFGEDDIMAGDEVIKPSLDKDLERQIVNAIDPRFLLQLTNVLFGGLSCVVGSHNGVDEKEVASISAACAFLHVAFNTLPLERIMTVLAYRTELVPVLWNFMKRCHENEKWSTLSECDYLRGESSGWLLPLAVFCPVYKHMLMIVDNEEFYEQQKPLSLKDIRCLIVILRQALWQLLWVMPMTAPNPPKSSKAPADGMNRLDLIKGRVSLVASELLSQLQDWNNRRQFAPSSDFHAGGVNEFFISQAAMENTRANDILKQAPFLVPFTSRVKIFASQLAAYRQKHGSQSVFPRNRFRIRRDHILEDAYNQMSALSEEDLRGLIRPLMCNMDCLRKLLITCSIPILGTLLAKAMYEGILVDIPFATFFLSKLKRKYNYLHDLPSLDPELYRHLIFLKHYDGDVSELELYFVIVNNEYGEQTEEELLPGGKNKRVTNESVITFIHLVANHRLNIQIRQQSLHFLRGFQQLIQKEWIDMFNEHELQLLISGSLDSLDVDDLRSNTNYAGGYHSEHYVIEMFWGVIKGFSSENQKKFLKFVTGCSRGPLLGFKYLEPSFCIQRAAGSASEEALDRLPTSATCMNLLKLPPYRSKEQMEAKLLYAINAEAGFDLS